MRSSIFMGATLILLGALALAFNLAGSMLGLSGWYGGIVRFWPLGVIMVGWLLVLFPILVRGWRGLGGLFIPGVPILTTGGILLLGSLFDWWEAWEWLWPLEVLSLALGFLFAAIYLQSIWLVVPAIIIGINGLVLQFCAVTDLWEMWAVLWTVEPLAVGLSLLAVALVKRWPGLFVAGLILCGLAGVGFLMITGILAATVSWPWLWLVELAAPIILILAGTLLIAWNVAYRSKVSHPF
ncbi:MAG: hypothetical protein JXM69_19995 [Anaerolineae bacterium]|nr:hypothetical protein [Anaerolineae bacterium]